jgi:DNA segregation ATPase FtsK/SpoIIIE-like protein
VDLVEHDLGLEALGVREHARHQVRAHQAVRVAGPVVDFGGGHQLAALLQAGDEHRLEVGARGVDGGGVAGGAGAEDEQLAVLGSGHGALCYFNGCPDMGPPAGEFEVDPDGGTQYREKSPRRRRSTAEAVARAGPGGTGAAAVLPAGQPVHLFQRRPGVVAHRQRHRRHPQHRRAFGATIADLAFWLFGYAAYTVPLVLGGIAWIALFGLDSDGDGHVDFGPALRLIGIVGFLVSACGLLQLLGGAASTCRRSRAASWARSPAAPPAALFGQLANLVLFVILMLSVTLATGLSWFAVMDWIGGWCCAASRACPRRSRKRPNGSARAPARRARGRCARPTSSARQARAGADRGAAARSIEKSERAQREQQIPLFNVGGDTRCRRLSLLDDPKPQPKGYSEETLETLSRQIEFKLKDFRIEAQVVGAYPAR